MTGDDKRERKRIDAEASIRRSVGTRQDRPAPVLGAYDAVKGTDSFIVAAVDRDDAWLAVETGGERDLEEWQ